MNDTEILKWRNKKYFMEHHCNTDKKKFPSLKEAYLKIQAGNYVIFFNLLIVIYMIDASVINKLRGGMLVEDTKEIHGKKGGFRGVGCS